MTLLRRPDLDAAVTAGLITRAQADALEEFAAARAGRPHASDERFVIVNNFAEFFVAAGLVILASAFNVFLRVAGPVAGGFDPGSTRAALAGVWGPGGYFVFPPRQGGAGIVAPPPGGGGSGAAPAPPRPGGAGGVWGGAAPGAGAAPPS
ncbi:hypothetical protein WDZ92_49430, partial [Nostoc sp. NIES-2111]